MVGVRLADAAAPSLLHRNGYPDVAHPHSDAPTHTHLRPSTPIRLVDTATGCPDPAAVGTRPTGAAALGLLGKSGHPGVIWTPPSALTCALTCPPVALVWLLWVPCWLAQLHPACPASVTTQTPPGRHLHPSTPAHTRHGPYAAWCHFGVTSKGRYHVQQPFWPGCGGYQAG